MCDSVPGRTAPTGSGVNLGKERPGACGTADTEATVAVASARESTFIFFVDGRWSCSWTAVLLGVLLGV